jgi:hypothetical protein
VIITIEWTVSGGTRRSTYSGVIGSEDEQIKTQSQLYSIALARAARYAGFLDPKLERFTVLYYSIEFEDISRYNQAVS